MLGAIVGPTAVLSNCQDLLNDGIPLYDSAEVYNLPSPWLPGKDGIAAESQSCWQQHIQTAKRFYTTATDCIREGWAKQAMFNLHQAVQHTCIALLRSFTGSRSTSHNLSCFRFIFVCNYYRFIAHFVRFAKLLLV